MSEVLPALQDLQVRLEVDVPLGPRTWYGVGGTAEVVAHPSGVAQLAALVRRCHDLSVPVRVLGSGANLLVSDAGVRGVVVQMDDAGFAQVRVEGRTVTAGAGADLMKLVLEVARLGLGGLEQLAGIPATVGGAVRMNAGGAFGDIGRSVARVEVMDARGQVYYRDRDDLVFGYRSSNIVAPFILSVAFELTPQDPDELMTRVREIFMYKKASQPMAAASAGCAFKNPAPDAQTGETRAPAGRLIDQCGLKGYRIGGAEVSNVHANFIFAHPGCTASDILSLMDHVAATVRERTGIVLEREVVVW